ncbi:MAG: tRNA 2-thiouridine(34) synthase MnmA [Patescibacteria group bacterium]
MSEIRGKKVFVGLSGGVDSAVTAALLQEAGAEVYGVFIKGWYPDGLPCTWAADRRDAMRVAAFLRIPFHTLDASTEYKKFVIDYLLSEYGKGRTPNPDIMCNREVKFGVFYEFAKRHGADFIATGHYAQNVGGSLEKGVDPGKDQSYFLWAVPKQALEVTLFPLGKLQKNEVRKVAERMNLPNATKRDSQGICFLGNVSMEDFLRDEFKPSVGNACDESGTLVGTHDGALLHTLGERVTLTDAPPGPWYVKHKNLENNTLVVTKEQKSEASTSTFRLTQPNLFSEPKENEIVTAQYRYHGPFIEGIYDASTQTFTPREPVTEPVAAGQSLVLYKDSVVYGGGIIA